MSSTANKEDKPIPVTIVNGFLGAGKTTMILSLLEQLSAGSSEEASDTGAGKYQVVWLKNEFGVNEVDSLLAEQSSIASVKEILNGCLCCTLVGRLSDALQEILASVSCDRIIIETSGSAYAAPLAQEVNRLHLGAEGAPQLPVRLDGVVCVIDALNFVPTAESSPTARMQARYTDLLVLNKWELASERQLDTVLDHLNDASPETPIVRSDKGRVPPDLVFGLDDKLLGKLLTHPAPAASAATDVDVLHAEWLHDLDDHGHEELSAAAPPASPALGQPRYPLRGGLPFASLAGLSACLGLQQVVRAKGVLWLRDVPEEALPGAQARGAAAAPVVFNWAFGSYTLAALPASATPPPPSPLLCARLCAAPPAGMVASRLSLFGFDAAAAYVRAAIARALPVSVVAAAPAHQHQHQHGDDCATHGCPPAAAAHGCPSGSPSSRPSLYADVAAGRATAGVLLPVTDNHRH